MLQNDFNQRIELDIAIQPGTSRLVGIRLGSLGDVAKYWLLRE